MLDQLRTHQPDGRKRLFRQAILAELVDANGEPSEIKAIAKSVVAQARAGDMRAVEFLADRIDGKVPQAIVGDDELPPVSTDPRDVAKILGLIIMELKAKQEAAALIEGQVTDVTE